jgi:transcriptional regulator with XRE-family HTH domain
MKSRTPRPANDDETSWEQRIGRRIRDLREARNATLDQLARETKLTKGQISRIENGKVSSPVSTLTRIAAALGVSPGDLFSDHKAGARAVLVPKAQRRIIVGRASKMGHTYESLAFGLSFEKDFEPYLMTIEEENIDPKQNVFRHPGQELLFMLEGAMDYRHGEDTYHLEPGDSLYFDGSVAHGPAAIFGPPVRFLSIISTERE